MFVSTGKTRGSVLIITIVITAVLLSIGVTLAAIFQKEIVRQIYGRQSQVAMNIANSALECALYNDFRRSVFRSEELADRVYNSVDCGDLYPVRAGPIRQNNGQIKPANWAVEYIPSLGDEKGEDGSTGGAVGTGYYSFVVIRSEDGNIPGGKVPCAHVAVKKECPGNCQDNLIKTSMEVKGYHACSSGETESERRLVRRFRVRY